jgi:hypothetical protein
MSAALSDDDAFDFGPTAGTGLIGTVKYFQVDNITAATSSGGGEIGFPGA